MVVIKFKKKVLVIEHHTHRFTQLFYRMQWFITDFKFNISTTHILPYE